MSMLSEAWPDLFIAEPESATHIPLTQAVRAGRLVPRLTHEEESP
jgi:hypothetical protein